jgi:hypothetical protein
MRLRFPQRVERRRLDRDRGFGAAASQVSASTRIGSNGTTPRDRGALLQNHAIFPNGKPGTYTTRPVRKPGDVPTVIRRRDPLAPSRNNNRRSH